MYYNIDSRCPEVRSDNWQDCCRKGWRHLGNARRSLVHQNSSHIRHLQYLHGVTNVTIGDPFCDRTFRPNADRDRLSMGIYVRDVAEQVSSLYEEISTWERS